jgi:hypothetical protein
MCIRTKSGESDLQRERERREREIERRERERENNIVPSGRTNVCSNVVGRVSKSLMNGVGICTYAQIETGVV